MVKMKVLAWSDTGILGKEKLWAAHEGRINANVSVHWILHIHWAVVTAVVVLK